MDMSDQLQEFCRLNGVGAAPAKGDPADTGFLGKQGGNRSDLGVKRVEVGLEPLPFP